MNYNTQEIEKRWKAYWSENGTYKVVNDTTKPKFYILDMFPYPSGAGLHVGHPLGYIATDIYARYKRQGGFNVLHPMGFDAFGLPAEQYAIESGVHPAVSTDENIERYISQLDNIGFNYDWSRSVKTSDPEYYKWTQWIFLQLFEHYYDKDEDKCQPISKLIGIFETSGSNGVNASHAQEYGFTAHEWNAYDEVQKDEILMNYRLAFQKIGYVNWCEALGTVLANDEVKDGVSERGGHPVEKRAMKQWSLRITAYAERLLNDLNTVEWSDSLKAMQRNWIGRSQGAQLFFDVADSSHRIEVFTTRPDTIFGVTYMVLAPEHDLVTDLTTEVQKETIETYKAYVNSRSERDRMSEVKEVTGAFTGSYAINPMNGKKVPIWIGEYVLKDYGTGAIMAVPSDDDRDRVFATKFGLEIIDVVDKTAFHGATAKDKLGVMINSDFLNGMQVEIAIDEAIKRIESLRIGTRRINYKLRDANYSRQRYWGEPFPIKYDNMGIATPMDLNDLPHLLPDLDDFKPASGGKSPLARNESWVYKEEGYQRETDTMPGFAGSSWYFLRYMDANNSEAFASKEAVNYWQDVDLYVGGTEHAVGHLMYSRFWHKFLYDKGLVPTKEPFKKLINQGMIQGVIEYLYLDKSKVDGKSVFVSADLVDVGDEGNYALLPIYVDFVKHYGSPDSHLDANGIKKFVEWRPDYADAIFKASTGSYEVSKVAESIDIKILTKSEVGKMSKRYFNVVNPDDVVAANGADCFRMYEMFLGPIEQSKPWDTNGIDGVNKFLRKFWALYFEDGKSKITNETPSSEALKVLHQTIKKVSEDIEKFSFNTAVSAFMMCVNDLRKIQCHSRDILDPLVRLIAPFAPFISEELWHALGNDSSVHHAAYPVFDASHLVEDNIEYPVSVNGKKRASVLIPNGISPQEIERIALLDDQVKKWLEGAVVKKVIVVPGRMVNIVI